MKLQIAHSHVAVLVPSVRKAAELLRRFDCKIGKEEEWDSEGTREIYVELGKSNALLLMEPAKPGAYQRAMDKRGPGLHHLSIDVLDLQQYLASIANSGWSLHPVSEKTIAKTKTAWLFSRGFPGLIEVHERTELHLDPFFVKRVGLAVHGPEMQSLVQAAGLNEAVEIGAREFRLTLAGGQEVFLRDLL